MMIRMKNAIVTKDYQSEYITPFPVKAGTILIAEEKESEWEGWVWCRTPDDIYRWYPKGYLKGINEKPGQFELLRDYNAKELPVQAGETVTIQFEENDWAWVVKHGGDEGWVPLDNLEIVDR
jgi:hypothetical protein